MNVSRRTAITLTAAAVAARQAIGGAAEGNDPDAELRRLHQAYQEADAKLCAVVDRQDAARAAIRRALPPSPVTPEGLKTLEEVAYRRAFAIPLLPAGPIRAGAAEVCNQAEAALESYWAEVERCWNADLAALNAEEERLGEVMYAAWLAFIRHPARTHDGLALKLHVALD